MAVITISRQFGAGGKTLSDLVAKKMNYSIVDEQIIEKVAERANVSTNWVQSIEKEAGGKLLKFISKLVSKSFVDRILDDTKGYIDEDVYVDALKAVITQVAKEGNCIIVGRGGQFILQGNDDVFHVLLVAEKADRIKFMETHYDLLPTQAKNVVTTHEKRRVNLLKRFQVEDFDQPQFYDLVLNMSKISVEKASNIICKMIEA